MTRCYIGTAIVGLALIMLASCTPQPEGADVVHWVDDVKGHTPRAVYKVLVEYWAARSRLDFEKIYELEAPHVHYAMSESDFVGKYHQAARVVHISIRQIEQMHPQVLSFGLELKLENARTGKVETFYPQDRWIQVQGKWYHVWKNPFDKFL